MVTRLDHDANVRPWVQAAERARRDRALGWTSTRPPASCRRRRRRRARRAHPAGRRHRRVEPASAPGPTSPRIARRWRTRVGALVCVDGVHLTAHAPVDVAALGADFYVCSPYKFLGPHCGVPGRRAGAARDAAPGQAAALHRRRARAVRARHAALRAAGRHDRRGRLPRRARRRRRGDRREPGWPPRWPRSRSTRTGCASGSRTGCAALPGVTLWSRAAHRTPTLLLTFADRHGRPTPTGSSPSAGSTRPAGQLLRDRGLPPARAWATPAACGSGWRRTPTTTTSTGCSTACARSLRPLTGAGRDGTVPPGLRPGRGEAPTSVSAVRRAGHGSRSPSSQECPPWPATPCPARCTTSAWPRGSAARWRTPFRAEPGRGGGRQRLPHRRRRQRGLGPVDPGQRRGHRGAPGGQRRPADRQPAAGWPPSRAPAACRWSRPC